MVAADRVSPIVTGTVGALGAAERDWIVQALRQDGIAPTAECVAGLLQAVAASMATFAKAQRAASTHRERHDALHRIWQLANDSDPPVGQIRALLAGLPPGAPDEAEERAGRLWPRIFDIAYPREGLAAWLQTAPPDLLIESVLSLISDGGARVLGRARPGGKRSRPRFEPAILGQIRGKDDDASAPRGGRPAKAMEDKLVRNLALDWGLATGLAPQPGRSDQTGFGALVHHVFDWLGADGADQALRRFWDDSGDAVVVTTESGPVWF